MNFLALASELYIGNYEIEFENNDIHVTELPKSITDNIFVIVDIQSKHL